jgi:NAD(P)-dependent dehydrogenase (short-subunit alcohol dehydrogenase family)
VPIVQSQRTQQQGVDKRRWTEADIPDLSGRTALITGANAGLGLRTAGVLAEHGAHVILACRNPDKAERAARRIAAASPAATASVVRLDLASQASVRSAAEEIRAGFPSLDLLVNNAGVMDIPYQQTEDGFELTLATNHLGPFALTGLLLDRLAAGARIVTMSSVGHLQGVIDFDDLQSERKYQRGKAYAQSKLANLLFTYELDRRLRASGAQVSALASHPGIVDTELFANDPKLLQLLLSPSMRIFNFWFVQDVRMGALPALRAATDPAAQGGEYYGPRSYGLRRKFLSGYPAVVESSARSQVEADQARLWEASEQLTGVGYPTLK